MLTCQKDFFSLPDDLHYLNGAYMSPLSKAVEAAGIRGMAQKAIPSRIRADDFFSQCDLARERFAAIVNADPQRVAIIPAASYGISTVARNLNPQAGQHIVILHEQFPSNVYPWRGFRERGVQLTTVAPSGTEERGRKWNDNILEAITADTAIVALAHVHWTDGTRFDLETIGQRARDVGAALVIDGTQSIGALPFDVQQLQPDALIVAGYKWLMGPYGIGLAYYGERFDHGTPLEDNWIARQGSEDFSRLVDYQDSYAPGVIRYDMGERSNPILIPMLVQAMEDVLGRGVSRIQDYCADLVRGVLPEIADLGYRVEDDAWRGSHLFGIRLPQEVSLERLNESLSRQNVMVSVRGDAVRVSPNVYNDRSDMDALVQALRHGRNGVKSSII
jgi:selenocysteine lyase/cysteine desulfurase